MGITIKRARRAVQLCTDLAAYAEYDRAVAALDEAQKRDGQTIKPSDATRIAATLVQDIEDRMQAATLTFEVEAHRRDAWEAFEAAHPAREGDEVDGRFGIDLSALDEMIAASIVAVTDHDGESVEFAAGDWSELADEISQAQWQDFALAVLAVNRGVKAAPFSQSASRTTRASATA